MSRRSLRIMELMERPQGCTTDDISRDLGVTKDRARARVPQSAYLRAALDDLLKKHAATLRKVGKS
jgi:hypothetical protein